MSRPVLTIIAGSNGSGKNTLVAAAREKFQHAPVLDREAFAKSIQETLASEDPDTEAGKRVMRLAENLIAGRHSFTVVTTLAGDTYLHIAAHCKHAGFNVMLIFVATSSPEINIERLKARVKKGGHAVAESDLRRRYAGTLANVKRLLPQTDWAVLLDNSSAEGYQVAGYKDKGILHWKLEKPEWATSLQ